MIIMKTALSKAWIWLKEHWQIPFLAVWTVLVYVMSRRNSEAMLETIEAKKESYKKQIEILKNSHNDEILKRDRLTRKYQETLEELEQKYQKRIEDLTEVEKNEIKEVVIKSRGNTHEIRERIEREFGFRFVD